MIHTWGKDSARPETSCTRSCDKNLKSSDKTPEDELINLKVIFEDCQCIQLYVVVVMPSVSKECCSVDDVVGEVMPAY